MALNQPYSGTLAASTTEQSLVSGSSTLQTNATSGVYQLELDCSNMAAGDQYQIKIKEMVKAGGTQRVIQTIQLAGVQAAPVYVSASLLLMNGWDITLQQLEGAARSFDYSIRQVA